MREGNRTKLVLWGIFIVLAGYLDVQAQEEGLALLQADLGRHIRELEAEAKDRMRLSLVVGSVAGVLLIIILI